ncbi:EamA family transporter, partial [Paracoccus sp. PXZ]
APNFIGAASAGELVIARYAVYGLMAIAYLWLTGYDPFRRLGLADWVRAVLFGALGNSIYYFLTVMSVQAGDAATTALVIGTLPVLFAIVGNLRHPTTPWLHLLMAVAPITLGVVLLAHQGAADAGPRSIMIGIVFALAAMTSWLIYGLGNSAYMASDHSLTPMLWAALIGIGTLLSLPLLAVALTLRHGSLFSLEIAAYTP